MLVWDTTNRPRLAGTKATHWAHHHSDSNYSITLSQWASIHGFIMFHPYPYIVILRKVGGCRGSWTTWLADYYLWTAKNWSFGFPFPPLPSPFIPIHPHPTPRSSPVPRPTPRATARVDGRENGARPWRRSCRAASKLGDETARWVLDG